MKKTIVIGVTGGIAAYKVADLTSRLKKKGYDIHIIMTKSATEFITPLTLATLSQNKVVTDTFEMPEHYDVNHISLAKKADLCIIVPATANVIAKMACGLADDMLTTTVLAMSCPMIVCPAMNTMMYENAITQANIKRLKEVGMHIVSPDSGLLACGDVGKGRLASLDRIEAVIEYVISEKPLLGKSILISAGPTQEEMDPVRFITNHSSGKMGYALACQAYNFGATVTLVSGPTNLDYPYGVNVVAVNDSQAMYKAVMDRADKYDYLIMAAAVADYKPKMISEHKIKKTEGDLTLELARTQDILKALGQQKEAHQVLCGFAMETENLLANAKAKLIAKKADLIVANSINEKGAGFKVDTNIATIITLDNVQEYPQMSKDDLAKIILLEMKKRG